MPIRPRSGRLQVVRQRKSCSRSWSVGCFEAEHLAALGIHARHHMADRAVFAGGVHALKDQQQRPVIRGVMRVCPCSELVS